MEVQTEVVEPESVADEPVYMVDLAPDDMVIEGSDQVAEILQPGISEWSLTRIDGSGQVIPIASVIRMGEGELGRADPAAIQQQLLPLEVTFVSSAVWSEENRTAGSSTLTMVLLALLGLILAAEQSLAFWASYHASPNTVSSRPAPSLGGSR